MTYKYDSYDQVAFNSMETNCSTRKIGLKVGDYLAVTGRDGNWRIFLIRQGLPFIKLPFEDLCGAIEVAEWLSSIYTDYFPILDIYPDADLISLTQWTIPQGIQINEAFLKLPRNRAIKRQDVENAMLKEKLDVPEWASRLR